MARIDAVHDTGNTDGTDRFDSRHRQHGSRGSIQFTPQTAQMARIESVHATDTTDGTARFDSRHRHHRCHGSIRFTTQTARIARIDAVHDTGTTDGTDRFGSRPDRRVTRVSSGGTNAADSRSFTRNDGERAAAGSVGQGGRQTDPPFARTAQQPAPVGRLGSKNIHCAVPAFEWPRREWIREVVRQVV
jgi:hypothetical protein